jgi:hypothetical protein
LSVSAIVIARASNTIFQELRFIVFSSKVGRVREKSQKQIFTSASGL